MTAGYLGHADLSTVDRYTHVTGDELEAAAETIVSYGGLEHALQASGAPIRC